MGTFLMAYNMYQLQILPSKQQFVKIVQVYVAALVFLQCFHQGRNDCPLLFNPVVQVPGAKENPALSVSIGVD